MNNDKKRNDDTFDAEVAIIGYGPTGVSAAIALANQGVDTLVFERDREIYPRARAVTVNDWTMRCFQSVGVDSDLARDMDRTKALRWRTYSGDELMRIDFPPSDMGEHPTSYAIYQPHMEATLRKHAEHYGERLTVHYGVEAVAVDQDENGVTVTVDNTSAGERSTFRARYLLACDGGASTVRQGLGIPLIGSTVETRWVVIDARVKRWWPDRHVLTMWSDRRRPVVDIALACGNHRWEFPLEADECESDFMTHEQLWPLLESMGVTREDVDIHQHAFYSHHVRHAERWREGRVFLLGDAAHLMPPWAGSGMQSGVRDAFNLAWKLREVLQGRLPQSILDTYQTERAPNVAFLTDLSVKLGRIIKQEISEEELAEMAADPSPPPLLMPPVLQDGWLSGQSSEGSAIGRIIPQPRVADAKGRLGLLDDVMGCPFALLGDGIAPDRLLSSGQKRDWDRLGARYFRVISATDQGVGADDIVDLDGTLVKWLRDFGTRAVAIRPDRFVASDDAAGLGVPACD